jgi:aryl-alcohol dehydrogenase-like predicted oxidoreductase
MQTRKLGYSDLHITTVGLGTWAIGGEWTYGWGPQDDAESIAAIHRALELGINWIDTAAVYGVGHSEEVVGKALQGRRQGVIVATKFGRIADRATGKVYGDLKAESVRREAENSLRRLNIDFIDLYQMHWPSPEEDIEEAWGVVADLVREGKVRYGGVSNYNVAQLKRVQPIHPVASVQPPYSMLRRDVETALLPYCAAQNIGVVVYGPMQAGLLTGKFSAERVAALDAGDWRKRNEQFQEPRLSATLALIEKLRPIAACYHRTPAQLAIAWVLRRPEVTSAIVGARRPSQIEETAPAGDWSLPAEDIAEIEEYLAAREQSLR